MKDGVMDYRPCPGVVFDRLEGRLGLIFSEPQQRLYQLDAASTLVWQALWNEEGADRRPARHIAWELGCSESEAQYLIEACATQWRDAALIDNFPVSADASPQKGTAAAAELPIVAIKTDIDVFCLAGISLGVSYPDSAVEIAIREIAGHLRVRNSGCANFFLSIEASGPLYRVDSSMALPNAEAVGVWFKNTALEILLGSNSNLIAVHAAALRSPWGATLLAGSSGSGKTTLAATLNASGWPSISDDVVLIESGSTHVRGLPFAYAAKPGSWPLLQDFFPEVGARPSRVRPDGRTVRYVPPLEVSSNREADSVTTLVFPSYACNGELRMRMIDRSSALVRLLEEARNKEHHLSCDGFLTLCSVISRARTIALSYDDAKLAARVLMNGTATSVRD